MKFVPNDPPRVFRVGPRADIELKDCARIELASDEQVTFTTAAGGEYDVTRKEWGFYATPSVNGRLPGFGLRAALVKSGDGKRFVLLVEQRCRPAFDAYLVENKLAVVLWLDDDRVLDVIEHAAGREQ